MADRPPLRQPPGVVAAVLLICSLVGLLAGFGTSKLVSTLANAANLGQNGLGPHRTSTVTPTSSAALLPSPTATAIPSDISGFKVQAQVSPTAVVPGQQFTVTATVIAKDGVTPLGGILCTLGGTGGGNRSLFPQWPAGIVSNSNGEATWTLVAPHVSAGTYNVKVSATGADWSYYIITSVTISG